MTYNPTAAADTQVLKDARRVWRKVEFSVRDSGCVYTSSYPDMINLLKLPYRLFYIAKNSHADEKTRMSRKSIE